MGAVSPTSTGFDIDAIRRDFPILAQQINGHPLVYLDNAATTQKPEAVINAITEYYRRDNANVHRGVHTLSDRATAQFERAREDISAFIGAGSTCEVIWTSGTTGSINLVAYSWGRSQLKPGDRVLVSELEHHSNIVPWQLVCAEREAHVEPIPVTDAGGIDMVALAEMLDERVALVAVNHVSNALGTVNPVGEIAHLAHGVGAKTLVDGAQAVGHWPVDVQTLGCDFYTFSAHKMFGPTGIGVLWGKENLLEHMPPFFGGGEMIETVSFTGTTFNRLPFKFEAGTPNIAGAIGLAAAVRYINSLDREAAIDHEHLLFETAIRLAADIPQIRRIGGENPSAGIFSFLVDGTHPADLGMLLDQQGIAVRTGHHCAQPLMDRFNIPGTVRASFAFYNNLEDVDRLFEGIKKANSLLL